MKQGSRQSEDDHSISYTRLIEAQEAEEKLDKQQTHPKTPLPAPSLKPHPNIQTPQSRNQICLLDTIVSQDGPNIKIHYLSQQREAQQAPSRCQNPSLQHHKKNTIQQQLRETETGLKKTVLKSIQQNEMEYKRSDSSQRSMLESKIVNHVVIANIGKGDQPAQPSTHSNPLPTNMGVLSQKSQNHLFHSLPLEAGYIRPINESRELILEDELEQRRQESPEADRLTLRVSRPDKKSAVVRETPGLLSSLVTSKNRGGERITGCQDKTTREERKKERKSFSMKQLLLLKLGRMERVISERKQVAKREELQVKQDIKNQKGKQRQSTQQLDLILSNLSMHQLRILLTNATAWLKEQALYNNCSTQAKISLHSLFEGVSSINSSTDHESKGDQKRTNLSHLKVEVLPRIGYCFVGAPCLNDGALKRGIQIVMDQYAYSGCFRENFKEGFGRIVYLDNATYQGQWTLDKFNGQGTYTSSRGDVYQGGFAEGKRSGFGKEWFSNGDNYEGSYYNNLFEGTGVYCWRNGSIYRGQFRNSKMNGFGEWSSNDGHRYLGEYKDGVKEGRGTYLWKNGTAYRGFFTQGKPLSKSRQKLKPEKRSINRKTGSNQMLEYKYPTNQKQSQCHFTVYF